MLFSIIVVSYNAGEKLEATVRSCLLQSYKSIEIVIKDACSKDGSLEFLKNIDDDRIKLIQKKDSGIYDGMNQAIQYVSGDLTIFMNCGDSFYNNNVLENVKTLIGKVRKRTIYYGDCFVVNRNGVVVLPDKWDDYCCYRHTICHQAMFYSTDVIQEKQFDTTSTISACITHYIEAYAKEGVELVHLPMVVCNYEGGGVSDTSEGRRKSLNAQYKMLRNCFGKKHLKYMLKMSISGQLLKQKISTIPWLHGVYESIASIVYSRRRIH